MTLSLFRSPVEGLTILPGRASAPEVIAAVEAVAAVAPFRHQVTPGGGVMSVAMTNCGDVGWVTDRRGYRYDPVDPESGARWPEIPASWRTLAEACAAEAGFRTEIRGTLRGLLRGQATYGQALPRLGQRGVTAIQGVIDSNLGPALKPSTVARKGSSRTLIDKGRLRAAQSFKVR